MSDTHEIWRYIDITKGKYSVSNMGRVKNNETGMLIKPIKIAKGYVRVNLHLENGLRSEQLLHRLVAMAFIPNPEDKPEVNHKNGIHNDNRLSNLEWVTGEENRRHAYETGLVKHKDERYSGYLYRLWCYRKAKCSIHEWCEPWNDFLVFRKWCIDNGYKDGDFIALKPGTNEYSPDNCYVSNKLVKTPKRRILYTKYSIQGIEMTTDEISKRFGISEQLFRYRIKRGMSAEEAALTPYRKAGRSRRKASE